MNALLQQLQASLLVTCYDPGALLIVSPSDGEEPRIQNRNFDRPMGMTLLDDQLAISTRQEVLTLRAVPAWEQHKDNTSYAANDALYLPRKVLFTGNVDMHDLSYAPDGTLWGVNTAFSCLCQLDDTASWIPEWLPAGMPGPQPGDWYHLNGMALRGNRPAYATSLGRGNGPRAWREKLPMGGILWDVPSGEAILTDLAMPHSPRLDGDTLWLLLSATGEVWKVDTRSGQYEVVNRLPALLRGMAVTQDHLWIGSSCIRQNAFAARHQYLEPEEAFAGIWVIDKKSGEMVGSLRFAAAIRDLFEICVLPEVLNPMVLGTATPAYREWNITPESLWPPTP